MTDRDELVERLMKEMVDISAAIGTVRFMDPPDGGDVTLAEQVSRMKAALAQAERERDYWKQDWEAGLAQYFRAERAEMALARWAEAALTRDVA